MQAAQLAEDENMLTGLLRRMIIKLVLIQIYYIGKGLDLARNSAELLQKHCAKSFSDMGKEEALSIFKVPAC